MFDINQFSSIYRITNLGAGETGSLVRISLKPVSAKKLRVLTHVSCENKTNAFAMVRLGIHNRGVDYFLDELQAVTKAELCVSQSDFLLGDGDRFFAEFTDTTDDDILVLSAFGWEQSL